MKSQIMQIPNWLNGQNQNSISNEWIDKVNPHNGEVISKFAASDHRDIDLAVSKALERFSEWSSLPPIVRGKKLYAIANIMKEKINVLADCISVETGKSQIQSINEVEAAIDQALYFAGEGARLHGRTLSSSLKGKSSYIIRQPIGIAGLIVPANTPIANIAWKIFPALICGNCVILKASEDAPRIAHLFGDIIKKSGIPDGVFNVIQGYGSVAGASLVTHKDVSIISFTGSTEVGKWIYSQASDQMKRISLELGGKNAFVVCDDADIDNAVKWANLSAFSNAGQRCAAASRLYIFDKVYDKFKKKLVDKSCSLKLGVDNNSDLGPVINKKQFDKILEFIEIAKKDNGEIICGGKSYSHANFKKGYYILPTLIENLKNNSVINKTEIFGPVATLTRIKNIYEAIELSNESEFGLTSAIHTQDLDTALLFSEKVRTGVVNINIGTFGSEPHMPFGGFGLSGNGSREPGLEALNVYSELKNISFVCNKI